jgi:hypothetical protein
MDVTKPYKFIWSGDVHGTKPYKLLGSRWAFISQTPVVLPVQKSGFRAGFRPDANRENLKIGPPAGLRTDGGPVSRLSGLESGLNPSRKHDFQSGSTSRNLE